MKVYQIKFVNNTNTKYNIRFYRTNRFCNLWDLIEEVQKDAEKIPKKEGEDWVVAEIKRID